MTEITNNETGDGKSPKRFRRDPTLEFIEKLETCAEQLGDMDDDDDIVIPLYFEPQLFAGDVLTKIEKLFGAKTPFLRDPHNSTLLHVAVTKSLDAVEKLFEMGADLRQCNVFGFTPLHTAMLAGQTEIALYLARKSPSVIGKPSLGWQLYQGTPYPGRPIQLWDCFKQATERSAIPQTLRDVYKQFSPKAGKVNKRFKKGLTDYHAIAFSNDFPKLPVTASPEEHAELRQRLESKNTRGDTPLICAVRGGAIDVVEELIEINISVVQTGFARTTPLLTACMFNDAGIAEILLQSSAELDLTSARDEYRFDAYLIAAKCNSRNVFDVLLQERSHVNFISSDNGDSTLYWVLANQLLERKELIKHLREDKGSGSVISDALKCADIYRSDHIKDVLSELEQELKQS